MPAFTHREPGVVGAVSDSEHVMAEIICDGVHIHPSMVRAAFKMMGADRMILISDSMRATGMPDGQYTLGGLDVKVVGNHATLVSDGALAGSVTNLADCLRTVVKRWRSHLRQLLHVRRSIRLRVLELKIHMVRSHRERKRISYY